MCLTNKGITKSEPRRTSSGRRGSTSKQRRRNHRGSPSGWRGRGRRVLVNLEGAQLVPEETWTFPQEGLWRTRTIITDEIEGCIVVACRFLTMPAVLMPLPLRRPLRRNRLLIRLLILLRLLLLLLLRLIFQRSGCHAERS